MKFAAQALIVGVVIPLITPAHAADLEPHVYSKAPIVNPAYNWSGFYIGLNAGGIWNEGINQLDPTGFSPGVVATTSSLKGSGFTGGGQLGANYQFGKLILGFETDISYAALHDTGSNISAVLNTTTGTTKLDWFGTVRGRAGFAATDNFLVYGTGGLAYADVKYSGSVLPFNASCNVTICYAGDNSKLMTGWAAGAGVEYAMFRNWSVKAEYLYFDLGKISNAMPEIPPPGAALTSSTNITGNVVRVGLNYKFQP